MLQLQNGGDTDWYAQPGFTGTNVDGLIMQTFLCVSPKMRVHFEGVPSGDYWLTLIAEAFPKI